MPNDDQDNYQFNDVRDYTDTEEMEGKGEASQPDVGVSYVVRVVSSGTATGPNVAYNCEIVELTNPETEGAALAYEGTGNYIIVTNTSSNRPSLGSSVVPVNKTGDHFAMNF